MAKRPRAFSSSGQESPRFGEASPEVLSDFLSDLNNSNKSRLQNISSLCGNFKQGKVVEHAFLICEELGLDASVGYHAVEILDRFMVQHIENFIISQRSEAGEGPSCRAKKHNEDLIYQSFRGKFQIFLLSSVQIASKLALHSSAVHNDSASRYLQSLGSSCPEEKLLETELLILKTLDFQLNMPNPLLYVETLLEVLAHNVPTMPVAQLHHLCRYVLQFIYLKRGPVYQSLLVAATGCLNPSPEQREKFVSVTEDCMLLGVGVITVSAYIYQTSVWEKVVEELTLITGISARSIIDFAHVTLMHITKNRAP
ncbi:cyclin N-terminal domain-containing protein 1 [Astyanax mexicanus]|uniref:Cyclin N-terminal domain containing 1 n=1 Tax=Astyanax mexicanus TaxID=7994 RepID=A0A8B9K303_ASTMX|nr:cyclin N-terminal domain-containing protein 1 [Astyanax mexicanus]